MPRIVKPRKHHKPVLVNEVLDVLQVGKNAHLNSQSKYIDATIGFAGHSIEILKKGGRILGIDADKRNLEIARERLVKACSVPNQKVGNQFTLVHANFRKIAQIANDNQFFPVEGILFDLGVSITQLTSQESGFSFSNPKAPLDMRLDLESQSIKASDLLNVLRFDQLMDMFSPFIGNSASRLSKAIITFRKRKPITIVGDLLNITEKIFYEKGAKKHPATLVFMALRIAVNTELDNLIEALPQAVSLLAKGGRLAVISFHSGEDKIVKHFFKEQAGRKVVSLIEGPILPTTEEIIQNPASRSAKLRAIEKI